MTASQLPAAGAPRAHDPAVPSWPVRTRDVLTFEWTKLRSVRSNRWTLLIAVVVTLGVTAIVAQSLASVPASGQPNPIDPLAGSFLGFAEYTVLPVTVLSVLVFTSEYGSGLIRTTFAAVPRRLAVLAAGFALAVSAVVGVGVGAIIRHTAGAIAVAVIVVYLLAVLCLVLPAPWNTRLGRFTLPFAAYQAVTLHPKATLLSPGLSILVLVAWPAVTLLVAGAVIVRRDV